MFVNYDKRLRPMYGVEPVQLYVSMGFLSISHIVEENMVARSTIYVFNVDLQIPYETKPGLIVSTNELEILNTKLMKGTFFGEEIETWPSVSKHTRPHSESRGPGFESYFRLPLAGTPVCRSELESEVILVYSPLVWVFKLLSSIWDNLQDEWIACELDKATKCTSTIKYL